MTQDGPWPSGQQMPPRTSAVSAALRGLNYGALCRQIAGGIENSAPLKTADYEPPPHATVSAGGLENLLSITRALLLARFIIPCRKLYFLRIRLFKRSTNLRGILRITGCAAPAINRCIWNLNTKGQEDNAVTVRFIISMARLGASRGSYLS